jgi:hypothetical protein
MPLNRLIEGQGSSFGPEDIKILHEAYEGALRALHLVDRNDPVTELVATKVIEISRSGISDPTLISTLTVKALGLA